MAELLEKGWVVHLERTWVVKKVVMTVDLKGSQLECLKVVKSVSRMVDYLAESWAEMTVESWAN